MPAKKTRKPTDEEILAAIGRHGSRAMTYVIRNVLSMEGFFAVETPWVRRQMKRLEREGRVARLSSPYVVQICWTAVDPQNQHGKKP